MNALRYLLLILTLSFMFNCTEKPVAGNSLETENSIAMQAINLNGKPIANARVLVRPAWFVADSTTALADSTLCIRNLTTDKDGWVEVQGLPEGNYIMEIRSDSVRGFADFAHFDTTTAIKLPKLTLLSTGALTGRIPLPASVKKAWVQIYGLDYGIETDSSGVFRFDSLPAGVVRIRAITEGQTTILAEDLTEIHASRVVDMETVSLPAIGTEDPATWQYEKFISLDSLISDWMLPLFDSTVVTIRLNKDNFDFTQPASDGSDLRVENIYGENLSFERARWDTRTAQAVIRVRVTKKLVNALSYLVLRWGHENAIDRAISDIWNGIPDSVQLLLNSVPVADFENASNLTGFPEPITANPWYTASSDSVVVSPTDDEDFTSALEDASAGRAGTAVHISYVQSGSGWALMGTTLNGYKNLATLDSIVFWARGNGKFSVAFDKLKTKTEGKAWAHMNLDSVWTRYSVATSDLLKADDIGGNIGWDAVKDSVSNLTFLSSTGTDFWLDDIRLHGIDRDDLK
jgi:hypothetical protein